jgi:dynein heavy chain
MQGILIVATPRPKSRVETCGAHVQGMMANRYMATFKDEIMGWNANLNAVADVTQLLIEIQRTWAYLESLFVGSEEVRKELPDAAARFADIDREVKAVLQVPALY